MKYNYILEKEKDEGKPDQTDLKYKRKSLFKKKKKSYNNGFIT